jgi:hypothetical protein
LPGLDVSAVAAAAELRRSAREDGNKVARKLYRLLPGFAFLLFGCSGYYHFDISGVVRTTEGDALPGVKIIVDLADRIEEASGYRGEFESGPDGSFSYELRVIPGPIDRFALRFSKAGYVEEKVTLELKAPKSFKEHVPVVANTRLKKAQRSQP